jgi:predicted DNA-binding transcriptional regulator AlpA
MNSETSPAIEPLWGVPELAAFLGKSPSWISHNRHRLPAPMRIGGELRWKRADVEAWADGQREARVLPFKKRDS